MGFVPRKQQYVVDGPDFEVVQERDRGAFAVRTRPRSEGNHHMYDQALILMRCVVAAEEYNMARHALPPTPASSQPARDFGGVALGRRAALEHRQRALEVPNPTTREAPGPERS